MSEENGFYVANGPVDVFSINMAGDVVPGDVINIPNVSAEVIQQDNLTVAQKYMSENYPEMIAEFRKVQEEQFEMVCKKNMDYGMNNIDMGGDTVNNDDDRKASVSGICVRLMDKVNRLKNLVLSDKTPNHESIEDTFMDASVYSIIALIVSRKKWGK